MDETERSGVDTNTSSDLSGIVGVLTERHQTGGLRVSLTGWLGDGENGNWGRFTENLEASSIPDLSKDRDSLTDHVGWHLDRNLELNLEG